MNIVKTKSGLVHLISSAKKQAKSIGFVPTMGALHEGHMSLIGRSVAENAITVCSIFVNPTQFNNKKDFERYPITLDEDLAKLKNEKCDMVFLPSVNEMYPEPDSTQYDLGGLEKTMEGIYRPGHFNGMAMIVLKLFASVNADIAYFGEKDFQQLAIVKYISKRYNLPIKIAGCPTLRDPDGLAMSSRNLLLSIEQRKNALVISKTLFGAKTLMNEKSPEGVKSWAKENIVQTSNLRLEYFEIVNSETLESIKNWDDATAINACVAAYAGEVRLIDNIRLK
jgi:pantoate--beta-alanine ligase